MHSQIIYRSMQNFIKDENFILISFESIITLVIPTSSIEYFFIFFIFLYTANI